MQGISTNSNSRLRDAYFDSDMLIGNTNYSEYKEGATGDVKSKMRE